MRRRRLISISNAWSHDFNGLTRFGTKACCDPSFSACRRRVHRQSERHVALFPFAVVGCSWSHQHRQDPSRGRAYARSYQDCVAAAERRKYSLRRRQLLAKMTRPSSSGSVIAEAWAEALKIRQQRHETLRRGLVLMTIDDVVESAQRKCRRVAETVGLV